MADIFLSYAKEDFARAKEIVAELEQLGLSVWWDDRLTPNESWDRLIEQEIADSLAVLALWTSASLASDWVRIEANYGKENKKLLQACLENCGTPLAFSMLQRADLVGWKPGQHHSGWDKLIEWITKVTGLKPEQAKRKGSARYNETTIAANTAYWNAFNIVADPLGVKRPTPSPVKANNYYLYLSKKPFISVAAYLTRSGQPRIGAYAAVWGDEATSIIEFLRADRAEIEAEFGEPLEWTKEGENVYWILARLYADPDDTADWARQHVWVAERMARLKKALEPRVKFILEQLL